MSAQVPIYPHRRKAVIDFIRGLPDDAMKRNESLQFLVHLTKMKETSAIPIVTLAWVQKMGLSEEEQERYLAVLVTGRAATPTFQTEYYINETPTLLFNLPQEEREQLANEIRAFSKVLPRNPTDREYVLQHLYEMSADFRKAFVNFLVNLPEDKAERTKTIDYLEYWNTEREKCIRTGHSIFSVWFHVTDPTEMAMIHVGILVLIVMFDSACSPGSRRCSYGSRSSATSTARSRCCSAWTR